ncbi:hypothetical protein SDC9_124810 [bioreactor metagenome]|uniref:Uncharacterized protein n=1 Tax=bioreactor metagenome TaxID=1076179 RepID=A0A645CLZ8_9ZZZZ
MDDRIEDIHPNPDFGISARNLDISLFQLQLLTEIIFSKRIWCQSQPHASRFKQRIMLIERSAAGDIKQDVIILGPHVQPDIATTAGHRLIGSGALGTPDGIIHCDIGITPPVLFNGFSLSRHICRTTFYYRRREAVKG